MLSPTMNVGSSNEVGPRPAEAHPLVARHVDDEAARGEGGPGRPQGGTSAARRCPAARSDHDVMPGKESRQRDPATISECLAAPGSAWSCSKRTMRAEWIG